jgi:molecular chaperone DnaK
VIRVGQRAKNQIIDSDGDAYVEFKRRMGTENEYTFRSSGKKMKPEELSAEVLKSLKADVQQRRGEEIQSAVITVPAAFELHQCDATRKAAELAGLKGSPLLQEPVAAALAYGFQVDTQKTYWLVYDFGGGTFDAAIIQAEEGSLNVVNHGGDNFLGGSDIDWAVVEKLILPQLSQGYDLPDFTRGNRKWATAMQKLKRAVEIAKIDLSRMDSTSIEDCRFEDASGGEVEVDIRLTRNELVKCALPIINRSLDICRKTLVEKSLSYSAIEKVILVGGPTLAPYFRDMLRDGLRIPLDHSVDPLTVVARGAAVFAGTQRVGRNFDTTPVTHGEFTVELTYKPMSSETDPMVGGKVISSERTSLAGYTVEFSNPATRWRSGKVTLREDGAFIVNLLAERNQRNTYHIELLDARGGQRKLVPSEMTYTVGVSVVDQPLINSIGIGLADNTVDVFFKKGSGLPLKKKARESFRTKKPLVKGKPGEILIPLVEGESEAADRNRVIGNLSIKSTDIKRDLDMGSEIEMTLKISESRVITMQAYVTALDEEFECQVDLSRKPVPSNLDAKFKTTLALLKQLKTDAREARENDALARLEKLEQSELYRELEVTLAARNDPDAAEKFEKRHLELLAQLDQIQAEIEWPKTVNEAQEALDGMMKLAEEYGRGEQKKRAEALKEDVADTIAEKKTDALRRQIQLIYRLRGEILATVPGFWTGQFRRLKSELPVMSDRDRAEQLFERGQAFIENDNLAGLRAVVIDLWKLCPADVVQASEARGIGDVTR